MLSIKNESGDFAIRVLFTALCASFVLQASAANLLEDVVPYYGPASASSKFPYSDFSTAPPSASLYVYTTSAFPNPYSVSSYVPSYAPPSGVPYPLGSVQGSWLPLNSTAAYPTGGWTHKVTPTSHHETVPLVTQTSVATVAAPTTPSSPSPVVGEQPNGAATLATSFAGLISVAVAAIFAL